MDDWLQYLYLSLPFLFVAAVALLSIVGIGIGVARPRFLVYPYLMIFFWMNSTSYGSTAVFAVPGVYTRGSGLLLFSLVLWYVLGAWCCARLSASFQRLAAPPCNLRPWFLGWLVLLAAHAAAGLASGVRLRESLAVSGFANIVWMAPLISLMLLSFRTREHASELARFILLAGLARALFGLVRWAALGGDPNNVYANMNAIHIKLTFFDINDSLLCAMAFTIAAVNLFQAGAGAGPRGWRMLEWMTLGATALCIVLSYRRTAWIGFLLAAAIVTMRFPPRRRAQLLVLGLPVIGTALLYAAIRRLSQTKGAGGGMSSLVFDMTSRRFGTESERVLELKLALSDFLAHLVTGIGSWGRYSGYQRISWQATSPDGGLFLHSGVLHIALKTGLPGLVLFTGTALAFISLGRRALRVLPPEHLGLATAGVAGMAFMLPDMLVGTPVPQVRTMQMLAVCMALPYVAMAVAGAAGAAPVRSTPAPRREPVAAQ
jgi:hypothetical protein